MPEVESKVEFLLKMIYDSLHFTVINRVLNFFLDVRDDLDVRLHQIYTISHRSFCF